MTADEPKPACFCCGETEPAFLLYVGNLAGYSTFHRKSGGSMPPDKVYCANCNLARAVTGSCPHQTPTPGVTDMLDHVAPEDLGRVKAWADDLRENYDDLYS